MLFYKRFNLAREYREWLEENPAVNDCPLSVITFLDLKGLLKDDNDQDHEVEVKHNGRVGL